MPVLIAVPPLDQTEILVAGSDFLPVGADVETTVRPDAGQPPDMGPGVLALRLHQAHQVAGLEALDALALARRPAREPVFVGADHLAGAAPGGLNGKRPEVRGDVHRRAGLAHASRVGPFPPGVTLCGAVELGPPVRPTPGVKAGSPDFIPQREAGGVQRGHVAQRRFGLGLDLFQHVGPVG